MASKNSISRAVDYFKRDVHKAWSDIICDLKGVSATQMGLYLLAGIYFKLSELTERQSRNGNHFKITGRKLEANIPVKVLEKDSHGRTRFIRVFTDSAVGGPDPTIRLSTSNSTVTGGGVRLNPGVSNEVGNVPDTEELWMASDIPFYVYIVEEA